MTVRRRTPAVAPTTYEQDLGKRLKSKRYCVGYLEAASKEGTAVFRRAVKDVAAVWLADELSAERGAETRGEAHSIVPSEPTRRAFAEGLAKAFMTPNDLKPPHMDPTATSRRAAERAARKRSEIIYDGEQVSFTNAEVHTHSVHAFLAGVRWARANPEWVSVTDGSPPAKGYYQIVKRLIPEDDLVCSAAYWDGEEWETTYVVTHWLPQPPLPRKETP
jgi:hypothetical protein